MTVLTLGDTFEPLANNQFAGEDHESKRDLIRRPLVCGSTMDVPESLDDVPSIPLAPIDPATDAARQRMREIESAEARGVLTPLAPTERRSKPWQFTLGQLIIANTILAVTLAVMQFLAPSFIAGILGIAAYAMLLRVTVYQPVRWNLYIVAWCLIGLYLFTAIAALLGR
jgi:hypothetical protein